MPLWRRRRLPPSLLFSFCLVAHDDFIGPASLDDDDDDDLLFLSLHAGTISSADLRFLLLFDARQKQTKETFVNFPHGRKRGEEGGGGGLWLLSLPAYHWGVLLWREGRGGGWRRKDPTVTHKNPHSTHTVRGRRKNERGKREGRLMIVLAPLQDMEDRGRRRRGGGFREGTHTHTTAHSQVRKRARRRSVPVFGEDGKGCLKD